MKTHNNPCPTSICTKVFDSRANTAPRHRPEVIIVERTPYFQQTTNPDSPPLVEQEQVGDKHDFQRDVPGPAKRPRLERHGAALRALYHGEANQFQRYPFSSPSRPPVAPLRMISDHLRSSEWASTSPWNDAHEPTLPTPAARRWRAVPTNPMAAPAVQVWVVRMIGIGQHNLAILNARSILSSTIMANPANSEKHIFDVALGSTAGRIMDSSNRRGLWWIATTKPTAAGSMLSTSLATVFDIFWYPCCCPELMATYAFAC
ncbi:hypothetical protein CEP51_016702 [Fusarium floridanum]|uniref:Uncharacterized protein n=1 Tax=Fusarium floridanum TaxID=1325733 RepID=A0A428NI40_9HYPO|nr:hypothetical protein CEP51_016702 [Fusarium floridanum]